MEVIIVDSISHEWDGAGGIIDVHSQMTGNSFTIWSKLTPRHNPFVQTILPSQAHVICTIRSKQDYVLSEKNGKQIPEKRGLKGVTGEGTDYEITAVLNWALSTMSHVEVVNDLFTSCLNGSRHSVMRSK